MTITKEILTVLASQYCPYHGLCHNDLLGLLTPAGNSAHNWRTKVTQSVRTLIELGFLKTYICSRYDTVKITNTGRAWLKENE